MERADLAVRPRRDPSRTPSEDLLDVPLLRRTWAELRRLPEADEDALCHRDLIPPASWLPMGVSSASWTAAASARRGSALDLVAAWHLLDETRRDILRRELECGEVQWWRGMAWAFQQAMGLVRYYLDSNPTMSRWGGRTLDRIVGGWTVPRERPGRPFTRAR